MKTNMLFVLALFCLLTPRLFAQTQTITVEANSDDISRNLDLKAVANLFGNSKDLEDFEKCLNDYDNQISNLDLNGDGEVDYLRVIETTEGKVHLVVIQAVLGKDIFQDVASILVEKDQTTQKITVQVVGNSYIYGSNYIVEPIYVHVPVIYNYFWRPVSSHWCSPYYWGYYPNYYRPRPFVHIDLYVSHIHYYLGRYPGSYRYPSKPHHAYNSNNEVSRHDYASRHPQGSYNARQGTRSGTYGNARDLGPTRPGRIGSTTESGSRQSSSENGRISTTPARTDGRVGSVNSERGENVTKPVGSRNGSGTKTNVTVTPSDSRSSSGTTTRVESSARTSTTRIEQDNTNRGSREVKPATSSSSSSTSTGTRTSSSSSRSGVSTSTSNPSSGRSSGSSSTVRSGGSSSPSSGTRSGGSSNGAGSRSGNDKGGRR